jgi:hypothetical protein
LKKKKKKKSPNLNFLNLFEDDNKMLLSQDNLKKKKINLFNNNNNFFGKSENNFFNVEKNENNSVNLLNVLSKQMSKNNEDLPSKQLQNEIIKIKLKKNNILANNKMKINSFITYDIKDLKNSNLIELQHLNKKTINEVICNLELCENDFEEYISLSDSINSYQKNYKENMYLSYENVENKIILYYEKILNLLEQKDLIDFHLLTNEFFLKRLCNHIFTVLQKEKRITSKFF